MASYMPQPDSGNTCCDCPSRTSPCDDCSCSHEIAFSVKFDQSEIDFDDSGLLTFTDGTHTTIAAVNSTGWYLIGSDIFLVINSGPVPFVADTWYDVSISFVDVGGTITVTFCVQNECVDTTIPETSMGGWDRIRIGDNGAAISHRSYKNISATSSVGSESNFNFPADSFDLLVGNTTVTTDGGDTVLRIDNDDEGSEGNYGQETLENAWSLNCICPRDCTEISSFSIDFSGSVTAHDDDPTCNVSDSESGSASWTRINRDQDFDDGVNQFKLYVNNSCQLIQEIHSADSGTAFGIGDSIFICPSACVSCADIMPPCDPVHGSGAIRGSWGDTSFFNIDNTAKTIDVGVTGGIEAGCRVYENDCSTGIGADVCFNDSGTVGDAVVGIPFTLLSVAAMIGSYNFAFSGSGWSVDMTVTVA